MRSDATTDISQPTHSSRIIRRYRTLAFRIARASALQITSLIRHIPLSSPCMSTPYFVYTACTILLLVPGDTTAMNNVRAGVTCLESMYETGYWMNCMKDGRDRILALARRWGVDIEQGCMVLGSVAGGLGGGGCGPSGPSTGERDNAESDGARPSDTGGDAQTSLGSSSGTRSILGPGGGIGGGATQPSTSTAMYDEEAKSGTARSRGHSDWTQQDTDNPLARAYTGQEYTGGIAPVPNDAASVPQENDNTLTLDVRYTTTNRGYGAWERNRNSHSHASGLMYAGPADGLANTPQEQVCIPTRPVQFETQIYGARNEYSSHTYSGIVGPELPVRHREGLVPAPQQQTYHQQTQYQHHHHKHTPSASIPHLNYTLSHAEPQHDSGLPHTHWHQTLPPADLNLPPPPDPAACSDLAMYFAGTIRTAQKPVFVKSMEEPRAGRAADGISDTECNFSAVTLDVYTGRGGMSSGTGMDAVVDMSTSGGVQGIYAQGNEARRNHRPGHLAYGYDGARYTGGYGGQGM
ncbi:hypothetical protein BDV93DRAFT_250715 [Ceratobasidium sp. AG-I]|nr:hypothetical protein BDV93DRAFT_250715 [Ceratobasidium sp. AG-I]